MSSLKSMNGQLADSFFLIILHKNDKVSKAAALLPALWTYILATSPWRYIGSTYPLNLLSLLPTLSSIPASP